MRFAKPSRILLPLFFSAVLVASASAQDYEGVKPGAVRNQLAGQPAGQPQAQSAPQPQAQPATQTAGSAPATTKAAAKSSPAAKAPAITKTAAVAKEASPAEPPAAAAVPKKPAAKPAPVAPKPAKPAAPKPAKPPFVKADEQKVSVAKRDPFDSLLNRGRAGEGPPQNLPPGKAGLIVATLRIDGIVSGPNGMIAIVSNPQQRVYFLHDGDKLYDGAVEKITLDGVTFREFGKDAFGKPLEHTVTKRLYPTPGEQQ